MKGMGTDEKALVDIIAYRNNPQRQELKLHYKTCYGRDLVDDIKSECSGNFEKVLLALLDLPPLFDAKCLGAAMKGAGTNENLLIEILCTRTSAQIKAIKVAYKEGFGRNLEEDLKSETKGDFERLLVGLSAAGRDDSDEVDQEKIDSDAKALYEAGEGKFGTDESEFQRVLLGRSYAHVRAVFDAYGNISKKSIEEAIKSEMSGDLQYSYLTIVKCVRNPSEYYADMLASSMKGIGTNEEKLMRCLVSRSEVDLGTIKAVYAAKHGKSLRDTIKGETRGDFENALLALINEQKS
ncbi:annexin A13-like isoform X2 [Antedon mediterranea]